MTKFDADALARAWLSVSLAASTDRERPALWRTVLVQSFTTGVRLVSTDSYILLRSWCPTVDHGGEPEPDLDEPPVLSTVVIDAHHRARGLFGHALALAVEAEKNEEEPVEVSLRLGLADQVVSESRSLVLEGMDPAFVMVEVPGRERLRLRVYEGEFPSWQSMFVGWRSRRAERVSLAPDMTSRVGKLGKLHRGALGFTFGGKDRPVLMEVIESSPHVVGLVMPCRWDLEENEPWQPPAPVPDEADDIEPQEDDQ